MGLHELRLTDSEWNMINQALLKFACNPDVCNESQYRKLSEIRLKIRNRK